jgi:hypothetical protein
VKKEGRGKKGNMRGPSKSLGVLLFVPILRKISKASDLDHLKVHSYAECAESFLAPEAFRLYSFVSFCHFGCILQSRVLPSTSYDTFLVNRKMLIPPREGVERQDHDS